MKRRERRLSASSQSVKPPEDLGRRTPNQHNNDWKDSRVIVALMAGAAVAVFFTTVIMPLSQKIDTNRISDLEARVDTLQREVADRATAAEEANARARRSEEAVRRLSQEVEQLTLGALFVPGDPYPESFRALRIGTRVSDAITHFSGREMEDLESWIAVNDLRPPFSSATYYKSDDLRNPVIEHILFQSMFLPTDQSVDYGAVIKTRLIESLGAPDTRRERNGEVVALCWSNRKGTDVELEIGSLTLLHLRRASRTDICT